MARITLNQVRHAYGADARGEGDYALKGVDLAFEDGGAYALLGPSGCGKTTVLNVISGLVRPTEGRVLFDDADVTSAPTERRNIAQVFQFPVIYDSMSVRENLAFPLRNRGLRGEALRARVDEVLGLIGLAEAAEKSARGLAGIDKQRLALGRGLVREDTAAVLLDEPLTQVDPHVRWSLRAMLRDMHRATRRTMIYVTHDQTEALTFADQVVVMFGGRVLQIASPEALFDQPGHTFVGKFIGSPGMNVLPVKVEGAGAHVGSHRVPLPGAPAKTPAGTVELGVRPEHVRIDRTGLPAQLVRVEDAGRRRIVHLTLEGMPIIAIAGEEAEIPADPRLTLERVHLFADGWRVDTGGREA